MANITRIGQLGSTGTSSGPHLHAYVLNRETGEYEDPSIHRSKFLGVRIGPNRVPQYISDDKGNLILNPAAGLTQTSGWGYRNTGIEKASKFHKGLDLAGPIGTDVYVEGDIKFTPKPNAGGYGNLATWLTPDNKYELGYAHMKTLGEASDLTNTAKTESPGVNKDNFLLGYLLGTGFQQSQPQETAETQFKRQMVSQLMQPPQQSSLFQNLLSSVINETLS